MGARNQVGIGLSYRPARLHMLAELIPWNRFVGSLEAYPLKAYPLKWELQILTYTPLYDTLWSTYSGTEKYMYIYWWILAKNAHINGAWFFASSLILNGFILIISQYCFSFFPECPEQHLGSPAFAISPAGHWQGHLPAAGQLGPRLLPRPPPPSQPRPPPPARPGCGAAASAPPPGGTVRWVWQ